MEKINEKNKLKFHGLSSPEELIDMWKELKHDDDPNDLNVIWDYQQPNQLKKGFNIVNILYNPQTPDETGHYCLIIVNDKLKEVEYFNPVANHTADDKDKLRDLLKYFNKKGYDAFINLEGKQRENSENCGFHCLTHAYNYYVDERNKMWPPAKVEYYNGNVEEGFDNNDDAIEDLLKEVEKYKRRKTREEKDEKGGVQNTGDFEEDLLKVVRGIYYGLKYGFNQQTPERKKDKIGRKASGVKRLEEINIGAGLADEPGKDKKYNYTDLRDEIEY